MVVKNNARVSPGMSIVVGNTAGGTLTLTNDVYVATGKYDTGGHITLSSESSQNGDPCFLNLFGGVLETRYVAHGSGSGLATVNFDGGTLKAQASVTLISAHNKLEVIVGPKGGTIDSAGEAVTIAEPLTGTGGMTFAGGGTVTLNSVPSYSGKTTVELGTSLVVPSTIAGESLEVTIPEGLESGLYKVVAISGSGVFSDDVLSAVTLPAGVNLRLFLNAAKTEMWCTYAVLGDHVWVGGANGSLNVDGNWFPSGVPSGDNAVILNETAASLTNPEGSAFAPKSIKFHADTAPVTISGAAISGVSTIVNYSENQVEFENAVAFVEDIDVVQDPGAIKFTSGATGVGLARATDIHGAYNLTCTDDRVEHGGTTVKSDGVYNLPNATFHKHNGDFHIDVGGKAQVKDARIAASAGRTLLGTNDGEFKVDGEFVVEGNGGTPTHYTGGGTGTFIVNKIRVNQGANIVPMGAVGSKTVIGAGGIIRGEGYVRVSNNGSHWIGSCADWTMYYNELGVNTAEDKFVVYKHNSSTESTVTFDTTDFYDGTIGRTITCESLIGAVNAASAEKFKVNVTGCGKFVFANTVDNVLRRIDGHQFRDGRGHGERLAGEGARHAERHLHASLAHGWQQRADWRDRSQRRRDAEGRGVRHRHARRRTAAQRRRDAGIQLHRKECGAQARRPECHVWGFRESAGCRVEGGQDGRKGKLHDCRRTGERCHLRQIPVRRREAQVGGKHVR